VLIFVLSAIGARPSGHRKTVYESGFWLRTSCCKSQRVLDLKVLYTRIIEHIIKLIKLRKMLKLLYPQTIDPLSRLAASCHDFGI
jgi:hypothetical protein